MISTDFAPNESWDDAFLAFKLLLQPHKWRRGSDTEKVKAELKRRFFTTDSTVHLFFSGRTATYSFIKALNLEQGSEVLIQAFTCEAVPLPIIANGLKPVYVDIDPATYSMEPADLRQKITEKTKLIMLQHTFGITPAREEILALAQSKNIPVLEDITHGFDPELFKNDTFHTSKLLSFGRSKAFSSVFGGALVLEDRELAEKIEESIKKLQPPSISVIARTLFYKLAAMIVKSTYDIFIGKVLHKLFNALGLFIPEISRVEKRGEYDPKMEKSYPNCLASLLLHQLGKYEGTLKKRATATKIYSDYFSTKNNIQGALLSSKPLSRYPLLVENRKTILGSLMPQSIFIGKWYDQVIAPKQVDVTKLGYTPGSCPVAENTCEKVINLPTNVEEKEAKKVISCLGI